MATDTVNGTSSAADGMTPAERMMAQHLAQESHNPTVEEVPDEDALAHPAPSSQLKATPANVSTKAAGKQPLRSGAEEPASRQYKLDTQSEEAFPALGAPKSQAAQGAGSMWSRKPDMGTKAGSLNGKPAPASISSNAPSSGVVTPASTAPSQRSSLPQMTLPGRYTEQIQLNQSMLTPRNQLKKSVPEVLRDINKRSKANVELKSGPGGVVIFEGTGPVDAVRTALREVASQLCSKQTLPIPVPASVRGKIVGKQGATIQAISKKTGARINISKQEAAEILEDDDADNMVDVIVEGDPFAVEMAKQDILKIVDEHTSSLNTRLKHIPAEYYPFLSNPQNQRLSSLHSGRDLRMQIPQYHTWRGQAPTQPPVSRQPVTFAPQAGLPIQLSGDRQAVIEARAEIERQVEELKRQLTMEQMAVERGRHQFIVGDRGTSLNDFLRETGCSVILPPDSDDSEMLTVVGPPERIEEGINKIMDLASSMSMASADISKQHANAPGGGQAHAKDLTRYLQQRQAIQELERLHDARIVPDSSGAWQIYARDGKNAMKARSDVINLVSGHPPTRFQPIQVDPFFHDHVRQQLATQIRDQYGVHVVVPDQLDDSPVLLVFEDTTSAPQYQLPRRQPNPDEVRGFQQALQQAQQHILELAAGHNNIISKDVEAPVKFHDKIRRHVDRHQQGFSAGRIAPQVIFGGPQRVPGQRASAPIVNLRGPEADVDILMQSLLAFIEQEKRDELERGFTLDFEFPQKFANHLIGKRGENINRIREEFDVDIQLNDGKCEIKGPEAKANACKKHILDMAKKLEDEATHHLNIPAQYHRDLIGAQGGQVNRLQDRYGVRINFPRSKQSNDDAASEAGDSRRTNQAPNEVIIKGPSRGADACRDELLSLLQYIRDNSHAATVSVSQSQLPSLIGAGGKEMEALRLETGAQIDVPNAKDAADASGRVEIKLKGSKQAVEAAKKLIEERAKVFDNTKTRNLEVERRHHRHIIGPQGATLRNIITQAGGPDEARLHNRMVRFPKTEAEGNAIRIEAQSDIADAIVAAIEALVMEQESQVTENIDVKPEKHRLLIGRGGETRRQLEQQFGVTINVPRQAESGPQRSQVRIAGRPDNVEKAKAHIADLTKDVEGTTVTVPRRLHHAIADNGQFFRRLRSDHKVTVDHAGQRPPPKPTAPTPSRNVGGAVPLITDEPNGAQDTHSWETHDAISSAESGDIAWVLSGPSPEAVNAAQAKLAKALEEAEQQAKIGFLILPDPRAYRHVIGPGGSEINRIRKKTGTKIQVPRDQSKAEAIEIVGSESGIEDAKNIILEIIANNSR